MDFDDQLRRYFATADLEAISPDALKAGIGKMRVDLGLEQCHAQIAEHGDREDKQDQIGGGHTRSKPRISANAVEGGDLAVENW